MKKFILFCLGLFAIYSSAWAQSHAADPVKDIWLFEEETFLGDYNTRLAIAESFPDARVQILKKITETSSEEFLRARFPSAPPDWPDLIVHSLATPAEMDLLLDLKKKSQNKIFLTIVDDPKSRRDEIDLIVNPRHMPSVLTGTGNVIRPLGLPSRLNADVLNTEHAKYRTNFAHYPGPIVVLLIGGQTKNASFTIADAKALGETLRAAVKSVGGSLFVSNSRRTPQRAFEALLDELTGFPLYIYDVKAEDAGPNPYAALLSYADHIVVTGDSSSMMSDALTTGRPVYTFAPSSTVEERHRRFILDMVAAGRVQFLKPTLEGQAKARMRVQNDIHDAIEARREFRRSNTCGAQLNPGILKRFVNWTRTLR